MTLKTTQQADQDVFTAIAHPMRRDLLAALAQGERSVTDLTAPFEVSRSAISQHLGILRASGLVSVRQQGRERYYRVNAERLSEVQQWVNQFERLWTQKLDALEDYLDNMAADDDV
ncbi:MAG: metalloregulator ArsR/SmtB family transcription factor [Anaerolineae bacterium]|nr:metalloregulator ArsR/SmtB family transcription factor [Anaerolineae bacterium]